MPVRSSFTQVASSMHLHPFTLSVGYTQCLSQPIWISCNVVDAAVHLTACNFTANRSPWGGGALAVSRQARVFVSATRFLENSCRVVRKGASVGAVVNQALGEIFGSFGGGVLGGFGRIYGAAESANDYAGMSPWGLSRGRGSHCLVFGMIIDLLC